MVARYLAGFVALAAVALFSVVGCEPPLPGEVAEGVKRLEQKLDEQKLRVEEHLTEKQARENKEALESLRTRVEELAGENKALKAEVTELREGIADLLALAEHPGARLKGETASVRQLNLVDEEGTTRAALQTIDGGEPVLVVNSERGRRRHSVKLSALGKWFETYAMLLEGMPNDLLQPRRLMPLLDDSKNELLDDPLAGEPKEPKEPTAYDKAVEKTGDYKYGIDRAMLNEALADLSELGKQARVIPNYRNGRYEGFKLIGVRPGSLYRALGIRSGDIILSINGEPLNSPNRALELYSKLQHETQLVVGIKRRGKTLTFIYNIID